eukprot:3167441-Lingulodinium_polyedra.AAC.1
MGGVGEGQAYKVTLRKRSVEEGPQEPLRQQLVHGKSRKETGAVEGRPQEPLKQELEHGKGMEGAGA